jgi:hypothetical protein
MCGTELPFGEPSGRLARRPQSRARPQTGPLLIIEQHQNKQDTIKTIDGQIKKYNKDKKERSKVIFQKKEKDNRSRFQTQTQTIDEFDARDRPDE